MKIFLKKYNTIYRIKCNADSNSQSFNTWPKPFIKLFTSSSDSTLQINLKFEKTYKLKCTS